MTTPPDRDDLMSHLWNVTGYLTANEPLGLTFRELSIVLAGLTFEFPSPLMFRGHRVVIIPDEWVEAQTAHGNPHPARTRTIV